jgi:hypothetical protein
VVFIGLFLLGVFLWRERFGSEVTPHPLALALQKKNDFKSVPGCVFSFPFSKLFSFLTDLQRVMNKLIWVLCFVFIRLFPVTVLI